MKTKYYLADLTTKTAKELKCASLNDAVQLAKTAKALNERLGKRVMDIVTNECATIWEDERLAWYPSLGKIVEYTND